MPSLYTQAADRKRLAQEAMSKVLRENAGYSAVAARYRRSNHRISTYPLLHRMSPLLAQSGHP
jgi:hypothetical protein